MDQGGVGQTAHRFEYRQHGLVIMAINGAEIAQAKLLEYHPRGQQPLQALVHTLEQGADGLLADGQFAGNIPELIPYPVVEGVGDNARQVPGQASH